MHKFTKKIKHWKIKHTGHTISEISKTMKEEKKPEEV